MVAMLREIIFPMVSMIISNIPQVLSAEGNYIFRLLLWQLRCGIFELEQSPLVVVVACGFKPRDEECFGELFCKPPGHAIKIYSNV